MLQGIDVSKWQGNIDWKKVASDGITFAFIKCTEGGHVMEHASKGLVDPRFMENMKGAKGADLLAGPYHFAHVSHLTGTGKYPLLDDARSEASWFARMLMDSHYSIGADLPPVLDIEWGGSKGMSGTQVVDWCMVFLEEMVERVGVQPLIYCGPNFWRWKMLKDPRFNRYGRWATDIEGAPGFPRPTGDWEWLFHQYTFTGRVKGIDVNVDRNVFRGSMDELRNLSRRHLQTNHLLPRGPAVVDDNHWRPPVKLPMPTLDLRHGPGWGRAGSLVQGLLLSHGFGPDGLVGESGLPCGVPDLRTADLVETFQRSAGLRPDRIVGQKTWWALLSRGITITPDRLSWEPHAPLGLPTVNLSACAYDIQYNRLLEEPVARIQGLLMAHGYGPEGLADPRDRLPDAQCGIRTLRALMDFQRDLKLKPDGVVGPVTWSALICTGIYDD